jgi:pimeloyl-ACP methyl ester carboxylesterase
LTFVWLSTTGVAAFRYTHRRLAPFPELPPQVTWATLDQIRLKTPDGQEIGAWLNRRGDRPAVLLFLHGIADTRSFWLPTMERMARHGYASMAISFRSHGDSTGRYEDFGYSGRNDVAAAVHYLHEQFPGRPVVLVGNSLGSAAAIFAARSLGHDVSGYFLESPYHDLTTALKNRANVAPRPLNWLAIAGMQLWGHVLLPESARVIQPIDHVAEIPTDVPVTFMAARYEKRCQLWEVEDLYHRVQAHAQLVIVESIWHGCCTKTNPQQYDTALLNVLKMADSRSKEKRGRDLAISSGAGTQRGGRH